MTGRLRRVGGCLRAGLLVGLGAGWWLAQGDEPTGVDTRGEQVVVVYNSRMAESRALAFYYAGRRGVPTNQIRGLDLATGETFTRAEFRSTLERPLVQWLQEAQLLTFSPGATGAPPAALAASGRIAPRVTAGRIRYVVLCRGVPLRIARDETLVEPGQEQLPEPMRRNEAAVDSELALLPLSPGAFSLTGGWDNPVYRVTNSAAIKPEAGVLMVARLDGPTDAIVRRMIDDAITAETNGLWGRAYFDARGLTNGAYVLGDQWIRGAAEASRRMGFETVLDDRPELFPASLPLSQIALYAGWYSSGVAGAFASTNVEFMPGAFAYHLHSFNAETVRSAERQWVGPLLARGATVTFGSVYEPFLTGTFDLPVFFTRFMVFNFTFGEASYAAQPLLSWQGTVVGDPLYAPFRRRPGQEVEDWMKERHLRFEATKSPWYAWSCLQVANLTEAMGYPVSDAIGYLEQLPLTRESALLSEKLADLYFRQGKLRDCLEANTRALALPMSPQQRLRLMLNQAQVLALFRRTGEALALYQQVLREFPGYPDRLGVLKRMQPLARELGNEAEASRLESEIKRLTAPAGAK